MIPWPDLTTFLCAVAAEPGDDTARLAFADRLDEEGGQERCGACKGSGRHIQRSADTHWMPSFTYSIDGEVCPACSGSGWTPGVCARWAELLRVQCEIEILPACGHVANARWCTRCPDGSPQIVLRRRESTLLPDLAPVLMLGPGGDKKCRRCQGTGMHRYYPDLNGKPNYSDSAGCHKCEGLGHHGTGPLARLSPDAVEFRRGFPAVVRVERLAEVITEAGPTGWAREIIKTWPVEQLVPGDDGLIRRSSIRNYGQTWFIMYSPLPLALVRLLRERRQEDFASRDAATTALARAVADLTRASVYPAATSAASN